MFGQLLFGVRQSDSGVAVPPRDNTKKRMVLAGGVGIESLLPPAAGEAPKKRTVLQTGLGGDSLINKLAIKILQTHADRRSDDEINVIVNLLKLLKPIAELEQEPTRENLEYLAHHTKLVVMNPLDVVCRIGDPPSFVYYIIEGEVAITTLKAFKYDQETLSHNTMSVMGGKTCFGDVSVMANSTRTASCICTTHTQLMLINGKAFYFTLSSLIAKEKQKKLYSLTINPLLWKWEPPKLQGFYESLSKKLIKRPIGTLFMAAGQVNQVIFFISTGRVEISASLAYLRDELFPKKEFSFEDRKALEMMKTNQEENRTLPLLVLTTGGFFGWENRPGYPAMYEAKVISSECEVYQIPLNSLLLSIEGKGLKKETRDLIQARNEYIDFLAKKGASTRSKFIQSGPVIKKAEAHNLQSIENRFKRLRNETNFTINPLALKRIANQKKLKAEALEKFEGLRPLEASGDPLFTSASTNSLPTVSSPRRGIQGKKGYLLNKDKSYRKSNYCSTMVSENAQEKSDRCSFNDSLKIDLSVSNLYKYSIRKYMSPREGVYLTEAPPKNRATHRNNDGLEREDLTASQRFESIVKDKCMIRIKGIPGLDSSRRLPKSQLKADLIRAFEPLEASPGQLEKNLAIKKLTNEQTIV